MTERSSDENLFWEKLFPDAERRTRVQTFVDYITHQIDRVERVMLIRFEPGNERIYLILNPSTPDMIDDDLRELASPLFLTGATNLTPVSGLAMTRREVNQITEAINNSFTNSGWDIANWPWPFEFTEDSYQNLLKENRSIGAAEKFCLWEKNKPALQAVD